MGNSYDIKIRCISANIAHLYQIFLEVMFLKDKSFSDFIKKRFNPELYDKIIDPATLTQDTSYHYIANNIQQLAKHVGWNTKFISFDACNNNTEFMLVVEYCYNNESRYWYSLEEKAKQYPNVQFIEEITGDETSTKIYN